MKLGCKTIEIRKSEFVSKTQINKIKSNQNLRDILLTTAIKKIVKIGDSLNTWDFGEFSKCLRIWGIPQMPGNLGKP